MEQLEICEGEPFIPHDNQTGYTSCQGVATL